MTRRDDVHRIREGLLAAAAAIEPYVAGDVSYRRKVERGDPVTAADEAADAAEKADGDAKADAVEAPVADDLGDAPAGK